MFPGFTKSTSREGVAFVQAGDGHPVLLLHGFPETRAAWRKVAPRLAQRFSVVAADVPGYGESRRQKGQDKREMGRALVRFMRELGFERFAVVGHDRGARVAYRLALDHPGTVTHLGVLDIVPTLDVAEAMSYELAMEMANWFILAQPAPFPETLIAADPAFYVNHVLEAWGASGDVITDEARAEYVRAFHSPDVRSAVCDEYRAGATVDIEHDRADRADGQRIACPVLVLWSADDIAGRFFDPLSVWRRWARNVRGHAFDCGHFMMEQAPDTVADGIESLLARASAGAAHSLS